MKNRTYVLRTVLCICVIMIAGIIPGFAQQIEKGIKVSNGEYLGFLEYKPADYASKTSTRYPLIIFLHGIGERGNGTTELQKVTCCGIPRIIKRGHNMSFKWNGKTETFIVLSPQCPKSYGMWPNLFIEELIQYAKNNLRVDPDRIFLTGLSMGGGGTFKYISTAASQPKNLAAAATICAPCTFKEGKYVADANLPVWAFHAADDLTALASCTETAIRKINEQNPAVKPLKTIWPTGGHIVWDRVYTDTNYRYQGIVNIYEWFLGQDRTLPVNKLPVANAGNTINITTGTGIATLNASGSYDSDGKIVRYVWKKIEGPAAGVITSPFGTNASTTVTGLTVAGTYKYELNVVDDRASFTSDVVTVVVSSGAGIENNPPVAKAGSDITITLPVNTVKLDGSASSDEDGSITTYSWTKVSGPAGTLAAPTSSITNFNNLVAGTYVMKLKVTDNKGATAEDQVTVTVKPAPVIPNIAPVAKAGSDLTITLPVNSVTLNGSSSSDEDGNITKYAWTKVSGPAATLENAGSASANANNLVQGTYVFRLTVTDNDGATDLDDVTVTVKSAPNTAPTANAGNDITITLPVNKTLLYGSGSADSDGSIAGYEWSKISGPSQFIIADPTGMNTNFTNLVEGTYKIRLEVTDNKGATDADTIIVTVNAALPAPNVEPQAQAGGNKTITLPVNYTTLDGSSSWDEDGSIVSYNWSYVNGPESFVIAEPNSSTTQITGLTEGTYSFRLEVKDNNGAANADTIRIAVKAEATPPPAPNIIPVAKAGNDLVITLPNNEVSLDGSASNDEDGTLTSYSWMKISGPTRFRITDPSYHVTKIENLAEGEYAFRLQVKDNDGALAYDTVKVAVLKAPNMLPVSKAGSDQQVQLPDSDVTMTGLASYDSDGTVEKYFWEYVTGPEGAIIDDKFSATPTITGLKAGDYKFRLTVTDNEGASASDVVLVTVLPESPKIAPVAKAGGGIEMQLPASSARLNGSESYDPDGIIETFSWVKVSGPGGVTITNSTSEHPTIYVSEAGVYVIRLTVKDNDGKTDTDLVEITVLAPAPAQNKKPVANAGKDQSIAYPESTATVNAANSYDVDGTITGYTWSQVSGPSAAAIANPADSATEIRNLQTGEYLFEVKITDDKGDTSSDTISISIVNNLRYEEQMVLYPNPARSSVNVQLTSDTTGLTRITIYSASGVPVKAINTNKSQAQLFENVNIANLQTGMYYMEVIIAGKQRKIAKFVKRQ